MFSGLDLYYIWTDAAQPLTTEGEELDDLLRETIVNRTKYWYYEGP